jgi:hypothetical protein
MNRKGMMSMDMCLLLTSLEAIKCVYTYEKGKLKSSKKSSHKSKKGKKCPSTDSTVRVPKKSALRSIATCARIMGAHIPPTTHMIVVGLKRMKRRKPISAPLREAERKVIP